MYALRHSPQAANRLTLIEQWEAMRGEGITSTKAADILRVPRASLYRGAPASVAWLVESDGVSCVAAPEDAS